MGGQNREGTLDGPVTTLLAAHPDILTQHLCTSAGGKVKPLKQAKKDKKDLDDDDKAFLDKKRAGKREPTPSDAVCSTSHARF